MVDIEDCLISLGTVDENYVNINLKLTLDLKKDDIENYDWAYKATFFENDIGRDDQIVHDLVRIRPKKEGKHTFSHRFVIESSVLEEFVGIRDAVIDYRVDLKKRPKAWSDAGHAKSKKIRVKKHKE